MSSHPRTFRRRLVALTAATALGTTVLAACGSTATLDETTAGTSTSSEASTPSSSTETPAESSDAATVETSDSETAAPAEETAFPVTVTADNGEVTIDEQPTAIASLSPTATEMLYAVGAGSAVTVVDMYSEYPDGLPENKVDAYQLNIEALTAYNPDLVVLSYVSPDQQAQFDALGIKVLGLGAPADIAGAFSQISTLGQATGHASEADELVTQLQAKLAGILAEAPQPEQPLTYYWELDTTYYSVTSDTFIGGLMESLGFKSIADDAEGAAASGGYPQLSAEYILKADPDFIFLTDTVCCQESAETVAQRPGWNTLSAVTNGRVVGLNDNIASRWSPRLLDLLQTIVDAAKAQPVG